MKVNLYDGSKIDDDDSVDSAREKKQTHSNVRQNSLLIILVNSTKYGDDYNQNPIYCLVYAVLARANIGHIIITVMYG